MKKYIVVMFLISTSILCYGQSNFLNKLSDAAIELTKQKVEYAPNYYVIDYPNGDIPPNKGADADVIIRAYRKLGIDLQKAVHEDMVANFKNYPQKSKLDKPDTNIDHRNVSILWNFFARNATTGPLSSFCRDYVPGDLVFWDLGKDEIHVGIVVNIKQQNTDRYLIVQNIGKGQVLSDCLFAHKIVGHYQYQKLP